MITRYVNTASSAGGDGTTNATSGTNRAYASLNELEASEQAALSDSIEAICEGTTADTTAVTFDGWTTTASYYILIHTASANRHDGKWNTGKYRLDVGDQQFGTLCIKEDYIRLDGLQVTGTASGANKNSRIYIDSIAVGNDIRISNCVIRGEGTTSDTHMGIHATNSNIILKAWNCAIYNFTSSSNFSEYGMYLSCNTCEVYNCTVTSGGGYYGIRDIAGTVTVKNCAVFNNTDDIRDADTIDYCATDDGDGTNAVDWTQEATDWANVFMDYANGDFHLNNFTGTGKVIGMGVDDPGSGLYSDDIDGDVRSSIWDIGADEYVAVGGVSPTSVFYGSLTGPLGGPI